MGKLTYILNDTQKAYLNSCKTYELLSFYCVLNKNLLDRNINQAFQKEINNILKWR